MKFQPDSLAGTNTITRHAPGELWVGNNRFDRSMLVPWVGTVQPWEPSSIEELEPRHFEALLDLKPELVIFGSGPRIRFVSPALHRALIDRRIGVETMDTAAACRTYNVLVAEGRSAVAALLLPPVPATVRGA
ncbi:Mth938-like domain-containing protein [Aquabacterium humicola]|uniref:Mth938-like domain-containing protein n=1 Tax=Aquabacterium humicola TaxID=3237377 RepID=UPI002542B35C|nr:Mth938-like domain-containing protein [Rubrivivax pictus]